MARIWIPLPDRDFEPSEAAVPWRLLRDAGHQLVFATERGGQRAEADPLLLGDGVVFGKLGSSPEAKRLYRELEQAPEFREPRCWDELRVEDFDGLLIPGGHAQGMRQMLESASLRQQVLRFWKLHRPVGAICHGVLVLARTIDPATGKSVLHGQRTTTLPKYLEAGAHALSFWKHGRYYRTYRTFTEDEVRGALASPKRDFVLGPLVLSSPDRVKDDGSGFALRDGRYVSARWPGDSYAFARTLHTLLAARDASLGERAAGSSGDRASDQASP